MKKRTNSGFTLLELMVTVVIIGILASVAIPSYSRFAAKAKTSEAVHNLSAIADGAIRYFHEEHVDPNTGVVKRSQFPSTTQCRPRPATAPCNMYKANPSQWMQPLSETLCWRELNFAISKAHYYQYIYNSADVYSEFTAQAKGDLDCDKKYSIFTLKGRVDTATKEVVKSGLIVTDELE